MTANALNLALAKWDGAVECPIHNSFDCDCGIASHVPRYTSSLDAVHELTFNLSIVDYKRYTECLERIVERDNEKNCTGYHVCDATALQRCEAIARTVGVWEE